MRAGWSRSPVCTFCGGRWVEGEKKMKNTWPVVIGVTVLLLWPTVGHAHLVTTGFGPFYDGISHLAVSPGDLLGVLAVSSPLLIRKAGSAKPPLPSTLGPR